MPKSWQVGLCAISLIMVLPVSANCGPANLCRGLFDKIYLAHGFVTKQVAYRAPLEVTWELAGGPWRMLIGLLTPGVRDQSISFAVNARGALNYALRLGLTGDLVKGKWILDVGSGKSRFVNFVNALYAKSGTFAIGVDKFILRRGFLKADLKALPFKSGSFDLVTDVWTLLYFGQSSHYEILKKALSEYIRVTKPGGEIRITYDFPSKRYFARAMAELSRSQPVVYVFTPINPLLLLTATGVLRIVVLDESL